MAHNYKQLHIWKSGLDIVDQVYDFVSDMPKDERFNLISQSIRSACSVPANIAEGSAKSSQKDFKRFLEMALGSLYELETHLLIAQRRSYGDPSRLEKLFDAISEEQKMLFGMIKSVKATIAKDLTNKATLLLLAAGSLALLTSIF